MGSRDNIEVSTSCSGVRIFRVTKAEGTMFSEVFAALAASFFISTGSGEPVLISSFLLSTTCSSECGFPLSPRVSPISSKASFSSGDRLLSEFVFVFATEDNSGFAFGAVLFLLTGSSKVEPAPNFAPMASGSTIASAVRTIPKPLKPAKSRLRPYEGSPARSIGTRRSVP